MKHRSPIDRVAIENADPVCRPRKHVCLAVLVEVAKQRRGILRRPRQQVDRRCLERRCAPREMSAGLHSRRKFILSLCSRSYQSLRSRPCTANSILSIMSISTCVTRPAKFDVETVRQIRLSRPPPVVVNYIPDGRIGPEEPRGHVTESSACMHGLKTGASIAEPKHEQENVKWQVKKTRE